MIYFIGYFLYFLFALLDMNKKDIDCSSLTNIKTEVFIQDFIKYLCSKSNFKKKLIIAEISLILLSFILFVIGWIVHFIVQNAINKVNSAKNNKTEIKNII